MQVSAAGMDIDSLVRKYGDKVTFYGGIDTQHVLPEGPVERIRMETRKITEVFGNGGGYIIGPSQGIEADIPVEHILVMIEESRYK